MKKLVHFSAFWRQFQLTWADLTNGLRLILVVLLPLLIGPAIGQSKLAAMGMLGGVITANGGTSGRYRDRVADMLCIASVMAVIAFLASGLSASGAVLAIAAALLFPFVLNMLGIFGASARRVGLLVTIGFAMVLSGEGSWQTGVYVALSMLICSLWAMVPTLLLWPLRPYQPERQAVASYYRALAAFCGVLEGQMREESQRKVLKRARGQVWQDYNQAHSMVVAVHAGSEETPLPLQRLFLLTLHADRFFQTVISLGKFGESMPQAARVEPVRHALNAAVNEFGRVLRQVAASALNEKMQVETNELNRMLVEVKEREDELRHYMRSLMARYAAEPVGRANVLTRVHLTRLVDEEDYKGMMQVLQVLRTFHQVSNALLVIVATLKQQGQEESLLQTALRLPYRQEVKRKNPLETLKAQLTMQSTTFR